MNAECPWGRNRYADMTPLGVSRFRYSQLAEWMKPMYREMEKGLGYDACNRFIINAGNPHAWFQEVLNAVLADNPLLYDVCGIQYFSSCFSTQVVFSHRMSQEERGETDRRLYRMARDAAVKTWGMSAFEKELWVHDTLAAGTVYDTEAVNAHNILGALIDGRAVCQSMSLAASFMLNCLGVDAGVVTGEDASQPGVSHGWNIVWMEGEYHLDVTYDMARDSFGVRHNYFNLSDELLLRNRTCLQRTSCGSMDFNYHTVKRAAVYGGRGLTLLLNRLVSDRVAAYEFRLSQKICSDYTNTIIEEEIREAVKNNRVNATYMFSFSPATGVCSIRLSYGPRRMSPQ